MSEWPLFTAIKTAFAEAWCLSEHEYHVAGDEVPCVVARRVAGLERFGGNQLMDYFMVALDVARVSLRTAGYVHTHGDDFDGCSTCFDEKLGRDLDTGRQRLPLILCRQPAPDRDAPGLCLWCKHPVSVGEAKSPETVAERRERARARRDGMVPA